MGVGIQLRGESGNVIREVTDIQDVLARATGLDLSETRLLKYVVPWGDAVFNQAQASDLALDILDILAEHAEDRLGEVFRKVEPLVEALSSGTHLYLWFVGD